MRFPLPCFIRRIRARFALVKAPSQSEWTAAEITPVI
jgi:hypothetical protein